MNYESAQGELEKNLRAVNDLARNSIVVAATELMQKWPQLQSFHMGAAGSRFKRHGASALHDYDFGEIVYLREFRNFLLRVHALGIALAPFTVAADGTVTSEDKKCL